MPCAGSRNFPAMPCGHDLFERACTTLSVLRIPFKPSPGPTVPAGKPVMEIPAETARIWQKAQDPPVSSMHCRKASDQADCDLTILAILPDSPYYIPRTLFLRNIPRLLLSWDATIYLLWMRIGLGTMAKRSLEEESGDAATRSLCTL